MNYDYLYQLAKKTATSHQVKKCRQKRQKLANQRPGTRNSSPRTQPRQAAGTICRRSPIGTLRQIGCRPRRTGAPGHPLMGRKLLKKIGNTCSSSAKAICAVRISRYKLIGTLENAHLVVKTLRISADQRTVPLICRPRLRSSARFANAWLCRRCRGQIRM